MSVEFANQRIVIAVGPHRGEVKPRFLKVDGVVGIDTCMACYAMPGGTTLGQKFPNAWLVSGRKLGRFASEIYHHCIPTDPLPADEETAKLLLSELHDKKICAQSDAHDVILSMATAGIGRWVWISPSRETEC